MTRVVIEGSPAEVAAAIAADAERAIQAMRKSRQLRLFGVAADAMQLSFSGSVGLDPEFESDAAFVQGAELGKRVTLRVTACVVSGSVARKESKEEDSDTLTVKLRVESVEIEDAP